MFQQVFLDIGNPYTLSIINRLQGSTQAERVSTDFESAVDSYLDFDSASGVRLGQQRKQIWQMLPLCLVEYALDLRCNEPGIQQVDQPPLSDLRKAAEDIVREASVSDALTFCKPDANALT